MPPGIGTEGGGPSKPWKFWFNITYLTPLSEKSQRLKLTIKLASASNMCRYGGSFAVMHVPRSGSAVKLFTFALPEQNPDDDNMLNYQFSTNVNVDLTVGKNFRIDWNTFTSGGVVVPRDSIPYPEANVHP